MSEQSPRKSKNSKRGGSSSSGRKSSGGTKRKASPRRADPLPKETPLIEPPADLPGDAPGLESRDDPGDRENTFVDGNRAPTPGLVNGTRGRTNGLVNGNRGRTNGLVSGTRGETNGVVNGNRGRTNGLVNGTRGRTNGLANGTRGRTNGLVNGTGGHTNGLVNGNRGRTNGLVNGTRGRTNGLATGSIGRASDLTPPGEVSRRDLRIGAAIIVVAFALTPIIGYLAGTSQPRVELAIDGSFLDWAGIPLYSDPKDVRVESVDLEAFSLHTAQNKLLIYGRTAAPLFPGPKPASVYIFINPGNLGPGYAAPGIEAHYVAELYGWEGRLQGAIFREWSGGADPDNATAFVNRGNFPAAAAGREFELSLDEDAIGFRSGPGFHLRIGLTAEGVSDVGATVGITRGALVVEQRPLTSVVTTNTPVLELRMRALVGDVSIGGISVESVGGGLNRLPTTPFTIPAGTERVEAISLDPTGIPSGTFVTLRVTGVTATVVGSGDPARVTLSGEPARVYVANKPTPKVVDGIFDDWSSVDRDADEALPDSVDIWESATALTTEAFFYLRTEGSVLAGSFLPDRRDPEAFAPSQPNGTSTFIPIGREAGEDILRIFIDTDDRIPDGQPFGTLIADRWIELRGRMGRVTAKAMHAWNQTLGAWETVSYPFPFAFVGPQFEASAPLAFLGPTNNPRVAFAASDWTGIGDRSDPSQLRTTRGAPTVDPTHLPSSDYVPAHELVNVPFVDARCRSFPGEYDGAAFRGDVNMSFRVGRRDDMGYVFICIELFADKTDEPFWDLAEIMFDTLHDGGPSPQLDDRLFFVYNGDFTLFQYMGDGFGWTDCFLFCDPGNAAEGGFPFNHTVYEFRIAYIDVWGTWAPDTHQIAGFAIVAWDGGTGTRYTWGSDAVDDTVPETWGHIVIPEFGSIAWVIPGIVVVGFARRRRWRRGA